MNGPSGRGRVVGAVEAVPDITYEDRGMAMIAEVSDGDSTAFFVRIQSYDEADPPQHPIVDVIAGRRVRVTIEVLDEPQHELPTMTPEEVMEAILATGPITPRRVLTTITVELATMLIVRYAQSRPLNTGVVARMTRQLRRPDPEGDVFEEVRVTSDRTTVSGQHLLHAVVRSRIPARNISLVLGAESLPWLVGQ